MIDYDKANRQFPRQKAALTRALKKGHAAVVEACKKVIKEWDEVGSWPDDWHRWERALDDAWWDAKSKYIKDEIDEMPAHVSMDELRWQA